MPKKNAKKRAPIQDVIEFFQTKPVLTKAVEIVTFLFTIFGSFFISFAPPEVDTARGAVGLASFVTLALLLLISATARLYIKDRFKALWLVVFVVFFIVGVVSGFKYRQDRAQYAFAYPPGSTEVNTIGGIEMLPDAAQEMRDNGWDKATLLAEHGPQYITTIWEESSVNQAKGLLFKTYFFFVVGIAVSLFSLTEGLLSKSKKTRKRSPN
ncbi:MAG TPA: hypothetical protein VN476_18945 [Pyrinomonadaceae bacterium]|nr:hypothetical protein [Pyrinomonadaceae bacterium]